MGTIATPPLKKGLGGFSNTDKKSPLAPLFLKGGILGLKLMTLGYTGK